MLQVPLEEWCGQQNFLAFHAPDQAATGLSHDVVLLGVRFHKFTNIIATDFCVIGNRAHVAKLFFQMLWNTNIHFHAPKHTLISHLAQYPLGTHTLDLIQQSAYFGGDERLSRFVFFISYHTIHIPTSPRHGSLCCEYTRCWSSSVLTDQPSVSCVCH